MNAEALSKVQLKPVATSKGQDRSAPNLTLSGDVSQEKEEERRDYFFSTGLDRWYASLQDKTFKTEFLALSPDEARTIVSHWEKHYKDRTSDDPEPNETSTTVPKALHDLCSRIDSMISSLSGGSGDKGIFIKLSTRSPKDSHVAFFKAQKLYKARILDLSTPSPNNKLILLQEVLIESLKVMNGTEAVQLLMSSTRVGEDLQYALEPGDVGFSERASLVLREWVEIPLWAEFRGFVWNGNLTTVGQYNHPVVFPQLKQNVSLVLSDLKKFFDSVKAQIPLDRYIIDFAWTQSQVYLVEINPFDGEIVFPASTGLWSWERDRQQMTNGPLELRIREEELDTLSLKTNIDPMWRKVLF